jgi:glycosyltransferase involved in cell wall biosynthesis
MSEKPTLLDQERRSLRSVMNFATQLEGGGAQMVAAQLCSGFLELGFESSLLSFLYEKRSFELPGPKPSILVSQKPGLLGLPKLILRIFQLLRQHRPDVVLSHSVYTNLFVLPIAVLLRIPHRITVQHNETQDVSPLFQWFYALFHLLRINTHTVFVSDASYESYLRHYRCFERDSSVVKNLISIDWRSADPAVAGLVQLEPEERLLFAVGRLSRQKNHAVLVEAMKRVQGCKLVIAGEGELRPMLESQIREAGLEKSVILAGEIPREKIVALFGICDLFVMPSLYEGRSLAMLEAIQAGCSIVASRIPSFEEVLDSCPNDVAFFDLESPEDLAAKLQEAVASLPAWKAIPQRTQSLEERAAESGKAVNVQLCRSYCQNIGWSSCSA